MIHVSVSGSDWPGGPPIWLELGRRGKSPGYYWHSADGFGMSEKCQEYFLLFGRTDGAHESRTP